MSWGRAYTSVLPPIIPADRRVNWKPGVTLNGGIPNRTTIFTTLSPNGGTNDDTAQINTALANAGAIATSGSPQVVLLNPGVYNINNNIAGNNGVVHNYSWVTLRGSGLPPAMATGGNLSNDNLSSFNYVSGTFLVKNNRIADPNYPCISLARSPDIINSILSSTNITADIVRGTFTCTVASASGLTVGKLCLIDQCTDTDPNVAWGNRHDLSGYFTGSLSGTSLTVGAPQNGPTGVDGFGNATFSGTSMTINSSHATGYWPQVGVNTTSTGISVFNTAGTFRGYIVSGAYPGPYTMSQSNSSVTENVNIGGMVPTIVGYPIFDSACSAFYGFATGGTYPNFTMDRAVPTLTSVTLVAGGGTRRFFCRQDRSASQLMRITNISGTTITFETPFYYPFTVACKVQLSIFDEANWKILEGSSIENLGCYGGMGGDTGGNIGVGLTMNCWIKNVESYWANGQGIGILGGYRFEVRDSFMHETPNPNPGGGGYLCGLGTWASDCLFENCIMWAGNKNIVMRGAGGGNVAGYCYMDDSFGGTYPQSPEAGANAAHFTTTVFALIEGCYSHNFEADSFWGNSFCITVHRCHLSGIRGCSPTGDAPNITPCNNLRAYTSGAFSYGDFNGRRMADIQAYSFKHNFTGNVLGFSGQTFLGSQTTWLYESLDAVQDADLNVFIWNIGQQQNPGGFQWVTGSYLTQLRQGNWDWFTHTQKWHGIGGSTEYGGNPSPPFPFMPDSFYLPAKPAFFGSNPWPWVNPTNGVTSVLPAKLRFDNNTPNVP